MAKKRRSWKWIIIIAAVVLLAALAAFMFRGEDDRIEVIIEEVEQRDIYETVRATGRIFPEAEVKISSDVSGEIVDLFVREGDSVRAGQVLININPDAYASSVERGQAALNSAKSQYAMSQSQIEGSKAQIEQIKAQLSLAQKNHDRNNTLYTDGVISRVEFDQTESALETAKANLLAAESNLQSAQQGAQGSSFNVQSAEATLKELRTSLSRTTIKAPVDGVISKLSVRKGERVVGTMQMAGTEIMRIANLDAIQVKVDVSENDILSVSLSDTVDIEVDAYLDETFKGQVSHISNSASNIQGSMLSNSTGQVTNFEVEVRMDPRSYQHLSGKSDRHPFRPGMSASVDIYTDVAADVVSLPIGAVGARLQDKNDPKSKYDEVVFLMKGDTVIQQKIKTGIQDDEYIHIVDGLAVGQEVVTGPYSAVSDKLNSGIAVRKKEENSDERGNSN